MSIWRIVWFMLLLSSASLAHSDVSTSSDSNVACWLWPGVLPSRCGKTARIYALQGHFYRNGRFEPQGPEPGRSRQVNREIVPVYRMDRLPPSGALHDVAAPVVYAWRKKGWQVPGLQVDFDSPTAKLDRYGRWLRTENDQFRSVDAELQITSVTGLGDWLMTGHRDDLRKLNLAAGTIAFMFYHSGRSVEPLTMFVSALERRKSLIFQLGLLPTQQSDQRFDILRAAQGYRGDIVFHGLRANAGPCDSCESTPIRERSVETF